MDAVRAFFTAHLPGIYFMYGLAFFLTGVAVLLELTRSPALPVVRILPFLGAFGIIHGAHEWLETFQLLLPQPPSAPSEAFRLVVLVVSFMLLLEFGFRLLELDRGPGRWGLAGRVAVLVVFAGGLGSVVSVWGGEDAWAVAETWCRYSLALPGAILAAAGLMRQRYRLVRPQPDIARDMLVAGVAFLLYGIPGQLFIKASPLPPSNLLNTEHFLQAIGFPIQLWRAAAASVVAVFTIRALRLFELARVREVAALNRDRVETQRRLNAETAERSNLRRQLFRQVVLAQEEERHRIARELHDQAGQSLTAVSFGLAVLKSTLPDGDGDAVGRVSELQQLTERAMQELEQLTTRLRPAVLDDMGLVPALVTYADQCSACFPLIVDVQTRGHRRRLSSEAETALYRIAQEAVTNVVKHAQASHVLIELGFGDENLTLSVSDDGAGMDVEQARQAAASGRGWGLAGIRERAQLLGGELEMESAPGTGSRLDVRIPIGEEGARGNNSSAGGG